MDNINLYKFAFTIWENTQGNKSIVRQELIDKKGISSKEAKKIVDKISNNFYEVYQLCYGNNNDEKIEENNLNNDYKGEKDKKVEKEKIISEIKNNHIKNNTDTTVCCPKCGSSSITTTSKKLSVKRAVVGTALLNPLAGAVGAVTSKKLYCVCMKCGHKWKL